MIKFDKSKGVLKVKPYDLSMHMMHTKHRMSGALLHAHKKSKMIY